MRTFLIAASAVLAASSAQAQSLGGLKSLRDLAKAAQGTTSPSKEAPPPTATTNAPPRSEAAADSYAAYRNRVTVYQRDCASNSGQSDAKQTVCMQAYRIDDRITGMHCQAVLNYHGQFASVAAEEHAEETKQLCAAEYDRDSALGMEFGDVLAGRSTKKPAHGAGSVSSF